MWVYAAQMHMHIGYALHLLDALSLLGEGGTQHRGGSVTLLHRPEGGRASGLAYRGPSPLSIRLLASLS